MEEKVKVGVQMAGEGAAGVTYLRPGPPRPGSAGTGSIPAFIGAETGRLLTLAQSKDFAAR